MTQSYRVHLQEETGGWSEATFETHSKPIPESELPPALRKELVQGVIPMLGFVTTEQQQKFHAFLLISTPSMQVWGRACTPAGKILEIEGP
jgi:hypothetical protein